MKVRCAVLCALGVLWLRGADPGLTQVLNVYLLPMSGGLDQYLANKLTASGRYQVVTDPAHAQAILTDQVGEVFEDRMTELYPPPADEKQAEKKEPADDRIGMAMSEARAARRVSSFSRGRGNVFLVDRSSRRVLWSTWVRLRNTRPDEMNHVAGVVAERLDDAVKAEVKRLQREEQQANRAMRQTTPEPAKAPAAPAPAVSAPPTPAPSAPEPAPAPAAPAPGPPAPAPEPANPAPAK